MNRGYKSNEMINIMRSAIDKEEGEGGKEGQGTYCTDVIHKLLATVHISVC